MCLGEVGETMASISSPTFVLQLLHRLGGAPSSAFEKLGDPVQELGRRVLRVPVASAVRRWRLFWCRLGGKEVADLVFPLDGVGGDNQFWGPRWRTGMSPGRHATSSLVSLLAGHFIDPQSRWSAMVRPRFRLRRRLVFCPSSVSFAALEVNDELSLVLQGDPQELRCIFFLCWGPFYMCA